MKAKTKRELVEENARLEAEGMAIHKEKELIEDQWMLQMEEMGLLAEIVNATRPHANDTQLAHSMHYVVDALAAYDEWLDVREKAINGGN